MSTTAPRHGLKALEAAHAQNAAPDMGGRP